MKTITTCLIAAVLAAIMAGPAAAAILFTANYYWMPDGSTLIDPASGSGQENAYVKIQETVFDNVAGRDAINTGVANDLIHGAGLPAYDINVYAYTISNLNYGNAGPGGTGNGMGVTGFNIPDWWGVNGILYGPGGVGGGGPDWWSSPAANSGPGNFEWDINKDKDAFDGDGLGITGGTAANSYYIVVKDGTPHGVTTGAWVHTWTGEKPVGTQVEIVGAGGFGGAYMISAPVPVPGAMVLGAIGLGLAGWIGRRRKE